jgi:hypothetical protein
MYKFITSALIIAVFLTFPSCANKRNLKYEECLSEKYHLPIICTRIYIDRNAKDES